MEKEPEPTFSDWAAVFIFALGAIGIMLLMWFRPAYEEFLGEIVHHVIARQTA